MGTRRIRKLNKTRRKHGGAKLGEGVRGIAYDTYSESGDSLYSLAKSNKTSKIELFFADGNSQTITDENKIENLYESLKSLTDSISKIFKPSRFFSLTSASKEFSGEIETNKRVVDLYGLKNAVKYSTLTGVELDGKNISGAIFYGKTNIYAIFNRKCIGEYDMDIKQFTLDILESLNNFSENHNDIKLDNIVKCSDRYKLIDWDKNASKDKIITASTSTTNPVKLFLVFKFSAIVKMIFTKRNPQAKKWFILSEATATTEFKETYNRIMLEYEDEVNSKSKKQLFEKYKDTFDVFSFGMTILYAVIHFKLDYQKYKPLIEALTSLKDPLNAKEGLAFAKKFFKKQ